MKRVGALCLVLCLLLSACGVEADFVISRETCETSARTEGEDTGIFVLINKNSGKYHLDPDCVYASRMSEANRLEIRVKNEEYLTEHGYTPCAKCSSEK